MAARDIVLNHPGGAAFGTRNAMLKSCRRRPLKAPYLSMWKVTRRANFRLGADAVSK